MNLYELKRSGSCKDGTFGYLWREGFPFCLSLEPEQPIIPVGEYLCERAESPKREYDVFWIRNVPEHEDVQIHIVNVKYDTKGCVGIGMGISTFNHNIIEHIPESDGNIKGISFSGVAFESLMSVEKGPFTLRVS